MLLLTGSQRTGSSLLAEFLKQSGYEIEGDQDDGVGQHDDQNICLAYRRILNDETFPWSNYPATKSMDEVPFLRDYNPKVSKFPFLFMNPVLMQIWINERQNRDKFLILIREAEKVVLSKGNTAKRQRIFSTDSVMLKQTAEQLKQNWFDSFVLLLRSKIDYRTLLFPDFLDDWDSVWNALFEWGGLKAPLGAYRIWSELVDKNKVTAW